MRQKAEKRERNGKEWQSIMQNADRRDALAICRSVIGLFVCWSVLSFRRPVCLSFGRVRSPVGWSVVRSVGFGHQ